MSILEQIGYTTNDINIGVNHSREVLSQRLQEMIVKHFKLVYRIDATDERSKRLVVWLSVNIRNLASSIDEMTDGILETHIKIRQVLKDYLKSKGRRLSSYGDKHLLDFIDELTFEVKFLSRQLIEEEFPEYRVYLAKNGQFFSQTKDVLNKIFYRI